MRPVSPEVSFPKVEEGILDLWKKEKIPEANLQANKGKKRFVFYDGPPFANGSPHYGHILPGTTKDVIPRYWVMRGFHVERKWGWDCHGLPVEYEMEKELGLQGLHDIEKMGIAKFNESCRAIVLRYTKEWEKTIGRTGRWADFQNAYRTMDPEYMESTWWVFKSLWDKGLITEGHRVMPYSWRVSTPLSNFEANLNYKQVQDPAVTVKVRSAKDKNRYFLIWTTTPWTLPSNLAIAVNPQITYLEVFEKSSNSTLIVAETRFEKVFKDPSTVEIKKKVSGKSLEGEKYEPIFPYFKNHPKAFQVVLADYVTTEDGTGLVHQAPAFGEDDMATCQKYGIELVDPVDAEGKFTKLVPDYEGQFVKDADKGIIKALKTGGLLFHQDTIEHSYPFCWRTDTPLIYKAITTWFVKLEPLKKDLVANNLKTHWVPENIREGRFGNWLENARDWNISRNRFWGTPLPVWKCAECDDRECFGSRAELEKRSGAKISDLHKHFMDDIHFKCKKCKGTMNRTTEVLDCWFESGSMPYGQAHYPFENKKEFEESFPADFIAESLDQTRGWFYTLSVLGTALFNKAPFKNCVVSGLVLAEDGKKMSKRHKNYPDVNEILDNYGADALRIYLMNSPASHAEELKFSEAGVKEVIRSVLLPLWNAYSFFTTYADADKWDVKSFDLKTISSLSNPLDQWIVSRLQSLLETICQKMESYHLYEVVPAILNFIEELTNWYIRLNRRRFWKEGTDREKNEAYQTLYFVLTSFNRALAPLAPFITEEIFQNLERNNQGATSVHLSSFPEAQTKLKNTKLEEQMSLVQEIVYTGRTLRSNTNIKTRQPVAKFIVMSTNPKGKECVTQFQDILRTELNTKLVEFSSEIEKHVSIALKPNLKTLGPKLGQKLQSVRKAIGEASAETLKTLQTTGKAVFGEVEVSKEDLLIEYVPKASGLVQSSGSVVLWMDTNISEDLELEGISREIVNRIQRQRKEMGFNVTDRIRIKLSGEPKLQAASQAQKTYICEETLCSDYVLGAPADPSWVQDQINGLKLQFYIERL